MLESKKLRNSTLLTLIALGSILFNSACEPAPSMKANNAATPAPVAENQEKLTSVQREVKDMETAGFEIIYVFKRRDGGVFDKDDRQYLKANSPAETNRFVLTDDEKAFIAGSHFAFLPENLEMLKKRFVMEDFSKPIPPSNTNANVNTANVNTNAKSNTAPAAPEEKR